MSPNLSILRILNMNSGLIKDISLHAGLFEVGCEMYSRKSRGTLTWFTTLLSFFFGLNSFNALMLLTLNGSDFAVTLSLLNMEMGVVNVFTYFLFSLIATSAFSGATFFCLFKGLPADPNLLERLAKVESSSSLNTNMLENMQIGFFKRLEDNEKTNEVSLQKMNMHLEESDKARELALQKMNMNLEQTGKITNNALESQNRILQEAQKENMENAQAFKKQSKEFANVKKKIEKIEKTLTPGRTKLTCKSKLESLKGVKPSLATGMRNIGIRNVGEFLTTDPVTIAEKTNELHETVTSLQGQAQLLMIPGVDATDAELLTKVGVTSRKELANQDPVQLTRAIVNSINAHAEGKTTKSHVPTVDDVWSWIRSARH